MFWRICTKLIKLVANHIKRGKETIMSSNLNFHNNESCDLYLWILKCILERKSSEICIYLLYNIFAINYVKLIKFITNQKQRKQMFLRKTHEQSNKHKVKLIVDERHKNRQRFILDFEKKQKLYVKFQTFIFVLQFDWILFTINKYL